jgi:hypothetical protein
VIVASEKHSVAILLIIFASWTATSHGYGADCIGLAQYRDTELTQKWGALLQKRSLIADARNDVARLQDELNDWNWWTLSDIPEIAISIKTVTDLVSGVVASISPGGNAARLVVERGRTLTRTNVARRIADGIARGEQMSLMASEEFGELTLSLLAQELGGVGAALDTLKTSAENLERLKALAGEKLEYRALLIEQTQRLARQLERLDTQYVLLGQQSDVINGIRDAIDKHCGTKGQAVTTKAKKATAPTMRSVETATTPPDLQAVYRKCRDLPAEQVQPCIDRELGL